MYENFFELKCSPFRLSPDPSFLFSSERSKDALASISEAVGERKGFVVLTGEVGTGKTLVLRCLVEMWEREEIPFAYFIGPRLSTIDFLSYITFELGISVAEPTKGNLLRALYGFLLAQFEKGLTTVLVIDEAHQMPRSVLEEIRVLANFETADQKLIQIVLVGQPELDKKLDSPELRSLKQRIAVRCRLEPLREDEIRQYIERRLELAGAEEQASTIFPSETVKLIYRYSLGIPRLVNSICDQALIAAHARQVRVVPVEIINEVASQFRLDPALSHKQTEKPFSLVGKAERSVSEKQVSSVSNLPAVQAPDPDSILTPLNPSNEILAEAEPLDEPEASYGSSLGDISTPDEVESIPALPPATIVETPVLTGDRGAVARRDPVLRDKWSFQKRRWLEPGLLISLIIIVAVGAPVSVAMGMYMARRQRAHAKVPQQAAIPVPAILPIGQTAASVEPAAASSLRDVDVSSVEPTGPATGGGAFKPSGGLEHPTDRAKVVMRTLSRPVLKSPSRSISTEPPLIVGTQTKEVDIRTGVLGFTPAVPRPPNAIASERLQPAKLVSAPPPVYPLAARMRNTRGAVMIDAVVDETGKVIDAKVISGPDLLKQAAIDAVRTWKYEPAQLNGQPTLAHTQVRIDFSAP